MFEFIRVFWAECHRILAERAARKARFNAALAYNKLHTYSGLVGKWMCPTCNKVHQHFSTNGFTGRNFPACCGFYEGNRLSAEHATGLR